MRNLRSWITVCWVSVLVAGTAGAFPPGGGMGGAGGAPAASHDGAAAARPAPQAVGKVARLEGGQSVEEIFQGKKDLSGKDVAVRGQVVKVSNGVMGRNWLHLRDGTGAAGTDDLTVTTAGEAKVGDIVVVRGRLATDKDFGYGYRYVVLVEDAKVSKE